MYTDRYGFKKKKKKHSYYIANISLGNVQGYFW